jgi:hypothetical protein
MGNVIEGTDEELKKWMPILQQQYQAAYEQAKKEYNIQVKRQEIAALCLQGLLSTLTIERDAHSRFLAETAVMHADALIKELEKEQEA